ncbi:hypothetical protein YC2023_115977 [Brassica napus]
MAVTGVELKLFEEPGNAATSMENSCLNRGPYCTSTATTKKIYAYIILFDEEGDPRLSTFGLMENSRDGKSYSTLHLSLYGQVTTTFLTCRLIPGRVIFSLWNYAFRSFKRKTHSTYLCMCRASHLCTGEERIAIDGFISRQYENDDASKLVDLASKCLQSEAKDRPDTNTDIRSGSSRASGPGVHLVRHNSSGVHTIISALQARNGDRCSRYAQ